MNMQFSSPTGFGPIFNFSAGPNGNMQYPENQYPAHPGFGLQYLYPFQDQRGQLIADHNAMGDGKTESKPRLSKEEVDKLEKVFQENPKPSSSVKAQLADELGLERPRINNWFQNRRAKAKQEKRQEEYEARRIAEKEFGSNSSPVSPEEDAAAVRAEYLAEPIPKRMNPSTALFPDFDPLDTDMTEDNAVIAEFEPCFAMNSTQPRRDTRKTFQALPSLDVTASQMQFYGFSPESLSSPNFASLQGGEYATFMSPDNDIKREHIKDNMMNPSHGLPSPEDESTIAEAVARSHQRFFSAGSYSSSVGSPTQGEALLPQSLSTSSMDSFKSPPPPANLASRRKIPRPAALQAASLKSRALAASSTPKTTMDGSRRLDPSSPATAMRRIVSATGSISGRIQKSTAGTRSPMVFGRNSDAFLQYHTRSPASSVGPQTSPLSMAPTTPMTPAVLGMQSVAEPNVTTSADDESLLIGSATPLGLLASYGSAANLKTPPGTPGLVLNPAAQFSLQNFTASTDLIDQPILTPFFHGNFPEINIQNMPSYVEINDASLPSTPLYPNNMAMMDHASMSAAANGGAQFDWDANESVTSSRSSPGLSRSQIQFTQNMTPQDYNLHDR